MSLISVETSIDNNLLNGIVKLQKHFERLQATVASTSRATSRATSDIGGRSRAAAIRKDRDALRELNLELRRATSLWKGFARTTTVPVHQFSRGLVQSLGIGTLLGFGATVAGGLVSGYLSKGIINTGVQFDKMRASLITLYKGNQKIARQRFAMISEYAKETPFDLPDTFKGFIAMKRIGIDPTPKRMKIIGNYAAAYGQNFEDIALAIEDAMMGQWRRMVPFGIRPEILARMNPTAFGGSRGTTITNPNSALDTMLEYMSQHSSGMMDRLMGTVEGKWSNFKDALTRVFGNVYDAISPGLQALLKQLTDIVETLGGKLASSGWLERLNQLFSSGEFLNKLRTTFISITAGIAATAVTVRDDLIPAMQSMASTASDVWRFLKPSVEALGNFAQSKPVRGIANAFMFNEKKASPFGRSLRDVTIGATLGSLLYNGVAKPLLGVGMKSVPPLALLLASAAGLNYYRASHRASGGPVEDGLPYIVGEHGPELLIPKGKGRILPSRQVKPPRDPLGALRAIHEQADRNAGKGEEYIAGGKARTEAVLRDLRVREERQLLYRKNLSALRKELYAESGSGASGGSEGVLEYAARGAARRDAVLARRGTFGFRFGRFLSSAAETFGSFRELGIGGTVKLGAKSLLKPSNLLNLAKGAKNLSPYILAAIAEAYLSHKYEKTGSPLSAVGATAASAAGWTPALYGLATIGGFIGGPPVWIAAAIIATAAASRSMWKHIDTKDKRKDAEMLALHKSLQTPEGQARWKASFDKQKAKQRAMLRAMGKNIPKAVAKAVAPAAQTDTWSTRYKSFFEQLNESIPNVGASSWGGMKGYDWSPQDAIPAYGAYGKAGSVYGGLGYGGGNPFLSYGGWTGGGSRLNRGLTLGDVLRGVNATPVPVAVTVDTSGSGTVQSYIGSRIQSHLNDVLRKTSVRLR